MAAVNKIIFGSGEDDFFDFDGMKGPPQPKQPQIELITVAGRPGQILRGTGLRGDPFPLFARRFFATRDDAKDAIGPLTDLNGTTIALLFHDVEYGYFQVLKVIPDEPHACQSAIGSIVANPAAYLDIRFDMISTEPPPEDP